MKEIKLNPSEWTLLLDLKSQLAQAQGEMNRREASFVGAVYGLCAAKGINADKFDLTQMQIKDGLLRLNPKETPEPTPIDGNGKKAS